MTELPIYWNKFSTLTGSSSDETNTARQEAVHLVREYLQHGTLKMMPAELLQLSDHKISLFYQLLARERESRLVDGRVLSPVEGESDSGWMVRSDYCFLNVRAVGPEPQKPGRFIDALKLLPMLRVNAIHLAPFYDCLFGNVYAVDSLSRINPEVVDSCYLEGGLSPAEQLKLLIDAIHLLDMTVGFDLEPHTSQFSRVVLTHPRFFRWIQLAKNRKTLLNRVNMEDMLQPEQQEALCCKVEKVVKQALKQAKVSSFDDPSGDPATLKQLQGEVIRQLIEMGLWTIPNHTWNGIGLPSFKKYNFDGNYPEFEYLDAEGEDQSRHAFGMLTPVKFAQGLRPNRLPDEEHPALPWEDGINFFAGLFPAIRQEFRFDFVRLDYVDHVFDSVQPGSRDLPLSDRPTPYVLERVIKNARATAPWIGAMAERMAYDIKDYASVGFDLILGADVLRIPDNGFIRDMIRFQQEINELNGARQHPVSIQFAVDSHDTGHPEIDTNPAKYGWRGVMMRHFFTRFGSAGNGRRPKYEVIGNQDLTVGLYKANNEPVSLEWQSDSRMFQCYHTIEDLYNKFKVSIAHSYIREFEVTDDYAVWYIDRDDGFRQRLAAVCRPDLQSSKPLPEFNLYPFGQYWFDAARIDAIDLISGEASFVPINPDGTITVENLQPGEVRLFWIREDGTRLPETEL